MIDFRSGDKLKRSELNKKLKQRIYGGALMLIHKHEAYPRAEMAPSLVNKLIDEQLVFVENTKETTSFRNNVGVNCLLRLTEQGKAYIRRIDH